MSARPFLGQMRHRLVIEVPVDVPDDNGGVARSYIASGGIWAHIRTIRARPRYAAERGEAVATHHILFRAGPVVTVDMRLRKDARIFRITALDYFDDTSTFLRAVCEEIHP